ncbi:MAG: hydrogenobyrinic acid a,c-diamide synthase (glutamine-hydrolyzing), partial [Gammaproteobacteria bacterium]|nr:hydrogenobyrinic acid a,c-diamide synthase (glutamine-hydrolyzing) [Gammaproteobacteria bacterium]
MAHFFVSAAHKSSGKTILSIGLTAAFRARGLAVQTFKKGPDYIDPLWLTAASGRPCRNLDFFTMSRQEIESEFSGALQNADIGILEGNKGLYDGLDLDGSNSNAALAVLLQAPVLLVIDARGMTRGIAPLILGYQAFDPNIRIRGVILNKVGGSRHEGKLRRVIEHYTDVSVIGAVHHSPSLLIDERHLGLIPSNEASQARQKIDTLGKAVADQVDLDRVLDMARESPRFLPPAIHPSVTAHENIDAGVRIGYPRDKAFGFYYPGDLEKLQAAGADMIPFDSLSDHVLPGVDGLFLGGGFPETVMDELEANLPMREAVRNFVEAGGAVYAECGGLMYLARSLSWKGKTCKMAGVIQGDAVMHEKPQGRGYVVLEETGESPWPIRVEGEIAAHEFHYSTLENLDKDVRFAYRVKRGTGLDGCHDGFVYKNLLASYTHLKDSVGNQ